MAKIDSKKANELAKSGDENMVAMLESADEIRALKAIMDQEGGEKLTSALIADAMAALSLLLANYQTKTLPEIQGICATMNAKIELARSLYRAKENYAQVEDDIEQYLKENDV